MLFQQKNIVVHQRTPLVTKYLPLLQFPFNKNPDFLSHISGSHSALGTLLIVIYTIHVT